MARRAELYRILTLTLLLDWNKALFAQEVPAVLPHLFEHRLDTLEGLEFYGATARVVAENDGKALELEGLALIPELECENVGMSVEILAPGSCYPGIVFRFADFHAFELVYAVPATSGQCDAIQYDPVFNGSNTWQLHNGPAFQKQAQVPKDEWFTLRVDVVGKRARIQVGDQPPLVVESLSHEQTAGRIGLWTYLPAHFRNLRVTAPRLFEELSGDQIKAPPGAVDVWMLEGKGPIACESSGLLNLNRYLTTSEGEVKLSRTFALAQETDLELNFGFSDELRLNLDGELLFEGSHLFSGFESRETRGWVQPESNRIRHMGAGVHKLEAVLRVSEPFGWGMIVTLRGGRVNLLPVCD